MAHRFDPVRQFSFGLAIALAVAAAGWQLEQRRIFRIRAPIEPGCQADQQFHEHLRGHPEGDLREAAAPSRSATATRRAGRSEPLARRRVRQHLRQRGARRLDETHQARRQRSPSYLWLKIAAKTTRAASRSQGRRCRNSLPALSADELELLRLWIYAGAPARGTINGTQSLLNACLPTPSRSSSSRSSARARRRRAVRDAGVAARAERASTSSASRPTTTSPTRFRTRTRTRNGELFRFSGFELRQDPQSHHLLLYYSPLNFQRAASARSVVRRVDVRGGPRDAPEAATRSRPISRAGAAASASEFQKSFACIGFGPVGRAADHRRCGTGAGPCRSSPACSRRSR